MFFGCFFAFLHSHVFFYFIFVLFLFVCFVFLHYCIVLYCTCVSAYERIVTCINNSSLSTFAYLTNCSTDKGGEMKLCDLTNNIMFKSMSFLGKQEEATSSNTL